MSMVRLIRLWLSYYYGVLFMDRGLDSLDVLFMDRGLDSLGVLFMDRGLDSLDVSIKTIF